ncbi:MAG: alkaline phosphatase family protein, partial [Chromatiales bacterium]
GLNGLQLIEWGTHDRTFEPASEPPDLLAQLRQRYGPHPVDHCDRHGENDAGYERLLAGLLHGADQKTRIVLDLMEREDWDLLSCAYGETHCTGHQFWHFQDPSHPWYRADAPEALRSAIETVYRRVDEGLGRLITAAGADADVLVIASHGMARAIKGTQLLPEVLARLGLGSGGGAGISSRLRRVQSIISHAPEAARPFLKWLASTRGVKAIQRRSGALFDPLEAPETRAVALRNNRCGAIRLNLKGREPYGGVEPGAEASALVADIRRALLDLRHPDSGEAIVERVVTAAEAFGPDHHPDVPDVLVVFRQDLGPLERCVSDRVGRIHVPMYHPDYPRTGDHTPETRLWWLRGDGQPAPERRQGHVLDIAPTVLKLLGVDAVADADGRALV